LSSQCIYSLVRPSFDVYAVSIILSNMNNNEIVAINDNIVTVSSLSSRSDNLTCISLHFYKIDALENGVVKSDFTLTYNITQPWTVVYCSAEVVETKRGLCRYFLLCGPDRSHGSRSDTPFLRLYTADNREIALFVEFRLPTSLKTCLSELKFEILDGPTVCFVVQSDLYVATSDGDVQIYPTGANGGFRHLASWIQDDYLMISGVADNGQTKSKPAPSAAIQPAMLTLCINTLKHTFGCSYEALVPDVYMGIV